jgi:NAD(P)-dependent dehydrogenase (short-subunit alcohol dehydrogenase family)
MTELGGRRVLVIGASSGIGAAVVQELADGGARVAGAARRVDQITAEVAIACDVRDPDACASAVAAAFEKLGGLDGLIYATGAAPLRRLSAMSASEWDDVLRTNVVGASLVTAAALPHLTDTRGSAVYLSSDSVPTPWPGLGAYAASKAALETLVQAWSTEHPEVCFSTYVVGPTLTGIADGWDQELAADVMSRWVEDGYLDVNGVRPADAVAVEVVADLSAGWQT